MAGGRVQLEEAAVDGTFDDLLVLSEVASICRVPIATARFWARTGRIQSYKPGRRRLVRRRDLLAFIAAARCRATETEGSERTAEGILKAT